MKKIIFILILTLIILSGFLFIFLFNKNNSNCSNSLVSQNGKLHLENTNIVNENNETIQLKGFSSSGIQWTNDMLTEKNLKIVRDKFNTNTFRIAMYTLENGYIENSEKIYNDVINLTDILINLDMYIIIDWHILSDGDPNTYIEEAKDFFEKYSKKYSNYPNILYEICNEPNGLKITWDESIKPYANTIIPIIRNNSKDSLIIVGTPGNCQKFYDVLNNPLNYENILYACHNYVGSKTEDITISIDAMLNKNLPIIVTEWGLTDESGNGKLYFEKANEWLKYLEEKNISHINWSFSNTPYSSSIISSKYNPNSNKNILNYLNDSGKFLYKRKS